MGKSAIRLRVIVVVFAVVAAALVMIPKVSAATEVHLTAAGDYGARATTAGVQTRSRNWRPMHTSRLVILPIRMCPLNSSGATT